MTLSPDQIKLVVQMSNPTDYPAFIKTCRNLGLPVLTMNDYQIAVRQLFPNTQTVPNASTIIGRSPAGRSCCGGGTVK